MADVSSNQAAILGDPNFPKAALNETKGTQIRLYEDVYQQYSGRAFTVYEDRPMAIVGLEQRLKHVFDSKGCFGVFDRYFQRGLMWKRHGSVRVMREIDFKSGRNALVIPSWSWMAYEGKIGYLDLPFGGVDWTVCEAISPWKATTSHLVTTTRAGRRDLDGRKDFEVEIPVKARKFSFTDGNQSLCVLDDPQRTGSLCVIIGCNKRQHGATARTYILVVEKIAKGKYTRRGVGYLPRDWIDKDAEAGRLY